MEKFNIEWLEEPVPPEDYNGYSLLRNILEVPIAGEECHGVQEFKHLFEKGSLDIAQPDICNVGGITGAKKVACLAEENNIQVIPHVWGTPIAIAASLNLIGILEGKPWLEYDRSDNPLREELAKGKFPVAKNGKVKIPRGPGLGIEPEPEKLKKFLKEN